MARAGAAWLDVGAMSTAPYLRGAHPGGRRRPTASHWAVGLLTSKLDLPVSADTSRAGPARAALEAGARDHQRRDRPGRRSGPGPPGRRGRGAALVLMAVAEPRRAPPGRARGRRSRGLARGEPAPSRAPAGIPDERIVVDPGHRLLPAARRRLARVGLPRAGRPAGAARARPPALRRRLPQVLHRGHGRRGAIPAERLPGSLAAAAAAVLGGRPRDPRPRRGRDRPGGARGPGHPPRRAESGA